MNRLQGQSDLWSLPTKARSIRMQKRKSSPFSPKQFAAFCHFPWPQHPNCSWLCSVPVVILNITQYLGEVALHLQQQRTPGPQHADAGTWVIRPKAKCAIKRFTELNLSASQLWHYRAGMHLKFLNKDVLHPQHLCEGKCSYSYFSYRNYDKSYTYIARWGSMYRKHLDDMNEWGGESRNWGGKNRHYAQRCRYF